MRITLYSVIFFCFLISCINSSHDKLPDTHPDKKIRKQVLKVAVNHIKSQLQVTKKTVLENGAIVYSDGKTEYLIDTPNINTGEIDDDTYPDAIITLLIFRDKILIQKEHLILINKKKGKFIIGQVLDGDMKFLLIEDRTIYVETSKVDPDSPFYGCELCKEVHRYRFTDGKFKRIK